MSQDKSEKSENTEKLEAPALWEFAPLSQYVLPSAPAQSVAGDVWDSVKRIFKREEDPLTAPLKKERKLHGLSQVQLAHLVPALQWDHACEAFTHTLDPWLTDARPDLNVRCLVTAPHVDRASIIRQWAEHHDALVLEPPDLETVLQADGLVWPSSDGRVWVIADLERYFLRHAQGLRLIRDLLNHLGARRDQKVLLGCDSWAWSFLRRVCRAPMVGVLTLQAFDASRLERLFCDMAQVQAGNRISFLNAQNGHNIITVPDGAKGSRVELEHLAAHCRGNVGTAVSYWRESLRSTEQEPEPDRQEETGNASGHDHEQHVWVTTLLPQVTLPSGKDEDAFLLMHALLLHGGLDQEGLMQTLPMSPSRVQALIERMYQMGLLDVQGAVWQVRAIAYAAVRQVLVSHNYLADDL